MAGRRPRGESRRALLSALRGGPKEQKALMDLAGVPHQSYVSRLLCKLQQDGLVAHGFSLTPLGELEAIAGLPRSEAPNEP